MDHCKKSDQQHHPLFQCCCPSDFEIFFLLLYVFDTSQGLGSIVSLGKLSGICIKLYDF